MLKFAQKILHGIFPKSCIGCDSKIEFELKNSYLNLLCEQCRIEILQQSKLKIFNNCFYIWNYETTAEELIKQYKFKKKYKLSKLFAELTYDSLRTHNILSYKLPDWDLVCTVPSSKASLRSKRFNHSYMLGKAISKKCNFNLDNSVLISGKSRLNQAQLKKYQRKLNIKNAFKVNSDLVKNKKILVIDDIMTTGATLGECTRVLYQAGAKKVYGLVLAKRELYDF